MGFQKGNKLNPKSGAKRKKIEFFQIKTFIKSFKIKYARYSKISNDTKQYYLYTNCRVNCQEKFCQKIHLQKLPRLVYFHYDIFIIQNNCNLTPMEVSKVKKPL